MTIYDAAANRIAKRRKSLRLAHVDYASSGAYFVTICVKEMKQALGKIDSGQMNLNQLGHIAEQEWSTLPHHYDNVELDEFVIMPNHMHGILWIAGTNSAQEAVGAGLKPAPTQHGLSEIMRGYKTFSARKISKLRNSVSSQFWQRGFYEHIISDEVDLENHRGYVINNPLKWALDEYHL